MGLEPPSPQPSRSRGPSKRDVCETGEPVNGPKREKARIQFLSAALKIARADDHVYGNPWDVLLVDYFPRWQAVRRPETFSLSGTDGVSRRRYQTYAESRLEDNRFQAERRGILEEWATELCLVEQRDEITQPANWVVEEAQKSCEVWSRPEGAESAPAVWFRSLGGATHLAAPPGWIESVVIPMESARRGDDETWKAFAKRLRRAVKIYVRTLAREERKKQRTPKKERVPGKRSRHELDHFEWLVLFQCCGWRLKDIREVYPHVSSLDAIWKGLQSKAQLIGLTVRPKRLRKADVFRYDLASPSDSFLQ
jgi:hypothetical protein